MSKAWNEAIALQGLGNALSAFARSRAEKKAAQQQQMNFEAQLAQKALEIEDAKRNRVWQTQLDALKLTQPQTIYGQDKRTGQLTPQTVPGTSMEELRSTLPGLFSVGASSLAPVAKLAPFDSGKGSGSGAATSNPFETRRAQKIADAVANIETGAASREGDAVTLSNLAEGLRSGTYDPGPVAGRAAAVLQPEFQAAINAVRGIAIKEMGPLFKGPMSDRDVKLMVDAKFDPNLNDPETLAKNTELINIIAAENERYATAAKQYSAENGSLIGFEYSISPDAKAAFKELSTKPTKDKTAPLIGVPKAPTTVAPEKWTVDANGNPIKVK